MDKLLNLVAAMEEEFDDYYVSVSPLPDPEFDVLVVSRKIYEIDSNVTHAFNLSELDEFRREFDRFEVRTGVMEDIADVGAGVALSEYAGDGLGQHWVEIRVKV